MRLIFAKSNWERPEQPLPAFFADARRAGFEAVELCLPRSRESATEVRRGLADAGLALVALILTEGATPAEHRRSLEGKYLAALEFGPLLVNAHTGRDHFAPADNLALFRHGAELARRQGVPLCHETHRGRALHTAPAARAYLRDLPELALTADFSHWFCVHESDLADQPENVGAAIAAAWHIHARVGFDEGPQVSDPRLPGCAAWLGRHLDLWRRVVTSRRAQGATLLTITPEFGPPPYLPLDRAGRPVADPWEINLWMRDYLARELSA